MKEFINRPHYTEEELDRTMDAGGDIFREDEQGEIIVEATHESDNSKMTVKSEGEIASEIATVREDCSAALN